MEVKCTTTEKIQPSEDTIYLEVMQTAGDFDAEIISQIAVLKEKKRGVKAMLIDTFYKRFLLEGILEDQNRVTVKEADDKLKATQKELAACKLQERDTSETIHSLCETAGNAYLLFKSRITEIQKNMLSLEEKKKVLEGLKLEIKKRTSVKERHIKEKEIIAMIDKCQDSIDKGKLHVRQLEMALSRVQDKIEIIENLHQQPVDVIIMENLESCQSLKRKIEQLGCVKVEAIEEDKLEIELNNYHGDINNGLPKLLLTVTFTMKFLNCPVISDVQLNITSLDVNDIIQEAIQSNDLVALVHQLKTRWFSHLPLLSEIAKLQNRYAIDWIQEEGLLRVMAGRGGSVVCTLSISPTYPLSGHVSIVDIKGCDMDAVQIKAQTECKTLGEWVEFLEFKFGKP